MEKIKIVIWDLDDTFWEGTLSEGDVSPIDENIKLVRHFVDNGIMNSISSRNDYEKAKKALEGMGWEWFIFPRINWEPKGQQVKALLDTCSLRAENALFLDDNAMNLQEVLFYNPGINVLDINSAGAYDLLWGLQGKPDPRHDRLKQYKVLESKQDAASSFSSNDEFLMASNIKVKISSDCEAHFDRLFDLINRSNQLNFTKVRLNEDEFREILSDPKRQNGYVEVFDNFGEYGIVGFFSILNGHADHFLFSCRTIGMGIEQYVYAKLDYPDIEVVGEVRSKLNRSDCPRWINRENDESKAARKNRSKGGIRRKLNILLDGGCDLEQLAAYLRAGNARIDYRFNTGYIRHDHTYLWIGAREYSDQVKSELSKSLSFVGRSSFDDQIYRSKYDVVILSILMDYTLAVYRYKFDNSIVVTFGDYNKPITTEDYPAYAINKESVERLLNDYSCEGRIPPDVLFEHLQYIREHMAPNTALIIINGCEVPLEHEWEIDRYKVHQECNGVVDRFIEQSSNTYLLDMRKIVKSRDQVKDCIRHYNREVYYEMALELSSLINKIEGGNIFAQEGRRSLKLSIQRRIDALIGKWHI